MPIYEFVCKSCGLEFDDMRKVDDVKANCPVCGSESEKLMSAAAVVVKGSTNASIDTIIGADAEKRWTAIEERKNKRNKEQFGSISQQELNQKNQQRISGLLNRQNEAYSAISKAKAEAGVTRKQELDHVLKG
jgi:putative FmdB family regulatory protein